MSGAGMTLYVGNVPFEAAEVDLQVLFRAHGEVREVSLVMDQETGRHRGFAFVEMEDAAARAAIDALDGGEFMGNMLRVNQARDRGARPPRRAF